MCFLSVYLSYLIIRCLWNFDIQWTRQDGIPAGANVSLTVHYKEKDFHSTLKDFIHYISEKNSGACVSSYRWCLSPSIHRIHTSRSGAANWGGISQRPSHFSDVPQWCQRPPQSALLVWRNKREEGSKEDTEGKKISNCYLNRLQSLIQTEQHEHCGRVSC